MNGHRPLGGRNIASLVEGKTVAKSRVQEPARPLQVSRRPAVSREKQPKGARKSLHSAIAGV